MKNIAAIILAAGKGTRMKSELPKVLHPLCGRPMLSFVFDVVNELKIKTSVAVLGYRHQDVRKYVASGTKIAIQKQLKGTADAVKEALKQLKAFKGTILILYGDIPLLKKETLNKLIKRHHDAGAAMTILTARIEKPEGYGRILRDKYSSVCGIVEEKDADDYQKSIKEINTGIICFKQDALREALKLIKPNNRKKEYYLTDAVDIFYKKGYLIESVTVQDIAETMGINSRVELAQANKVMQQKVNERFMKDGISIVDPSSAFISFDAKIGRDSTINPFTVIENNVTIGKRCSIGPFIRLRSGTCLGDDVTLGNFLEVSRSSLGNKTVAKHFGYLGDSRIGTSVNIGAGTVTANYDAGQKSLTHIEDGAFIGSDTILIAPVTIGKAAKTGAGSVVIKHTKVASRETVVGVPAKPLQKAGKHG
jgi:bifunctional UDP-N-acetylglucosamine pyrophosphorylase/glucosamine-1-phosphate N-acetyltransferase